MASGETPSLDTIIQKSPILGSVAGRTDCGIKRYAFNDFPSADYADREYNARRKSLAQQVLEFLHANDGRLGVENLPGLSQDRNSSESLFCSIVDLGQLTARGPLTNSVFDLSPLYASAGVAAEYRPNDQRPEKRNPNLYSLLAEPYYSDLSSQRDRADFRWSNSAHTMPQLSLLDPGSHRYDRSHYVNLLRSLSAGTEPEKTLFGLYAMQWPTDIEGGSPQERLRLIKERILAASIIRTRISFTPSDQSLPGMIQISGIYNSRDLNDMGQLDQIAEICDTAAAKVRELEKHRDEFQLPETRHLMLNWLMTAMKWRAGESSSPALPHVPANSYAIGLDVLAVPQQQDWTVPFGDIRYVPTIETVESQQRPAAWMRRPEQELFTLDTTGDVPKLVPLDNK